MAEGTSRDGNKGEGTFKYQVNGYTLCRMSDDGWMAFDAAGKDMGVDFRTLRDARKWAKRERV